jgi:cytoskeletal protein CcmA (bactofilin family)
MLGKKQKNQQEKRRLEDKVQPNYSIIASQSSFIGNVKGKDDFLISGRLEGNVECKGMVRLSPGGQVQGDIHGKFVIIEGEINGNINRAVQVEIRESGCIKGNITTEKLAIAEGSFFQGKINMSQKGDKPTRFVEKREKNEEVKK